MKYIQFHFEETSITILWYAQRCAGKFNCLGACHSQLTATRGPANCYSGAQIEISTGLTPRMTPRHFWQKNVRPPAWAAFWTNQTRATESNSGCRWNPMKGIITVQSYKKISWALGRHPIVIGSPGWPDDFSSNRIFWNRFRFFFGSREQFLANKHNSQGLCLVKKVNHHANSRSALKSFSLLFGRWCLVFFCFWKKTLFAE